MVPSCSDARPLALQLEGLFDVELPRPLPDLSLDEIARSLEETVHTDPRRDPLRALVTALASDRTAPFLSLVGDLAEILFLPRAERSEYAAAPTSPGPWVFSKLMLEYAVWSSRVDDVVGVLLSPFCADRCPSPPVGCCHLLGYDMGLVPEGMLRVQELEARVRGWSIPPQPDRDACRYHTHAGCALRLFKTPACLQYVCAPMEAELRRVHGGEAARDLVAALHALGTCDIDRASVFEHLARVVRAGERCDTLGEDCARVVPIRRNPA